MSVFQGLRSELSLIPCDADQLQKTRAFIAAAERELYIHQSHQFLDALYNDNSSAAKPTWLPYDGVVPDGKQESAALLASLEYLEIFCNDFSFRDKINDASQTNFIIRFPHSGTSIRIVATWYTTGTSNHIFQLFFDTSTEMPRNFYSFDSWPQKECKKHRWCLPSTEDDEEATATASATLVPVIMFPLEDEDNAPIPRVLPENLKRLQSYLQTPYVGFIEFLGMCALAHHPDSIPEMLVFFETFKIKEMERNLMSTGAVDFAEPPMDPFAYFNATEYEQERLSMPDSFIFSESNLEQLQQLRPNPQTVQVDFSAPKVDNLSSLSQDVLIHMLRFLRPVASWKVLRVVNKILRSKLSEIVLESEILAEIHRLRASNEKINQNPFEYLGGCLLQTETHLSSLVGEISALQLLIMKAKEIEKKLICSHNLSEGGILRDMPIKVSILELSVINKTDGVAEYFNLKNMFCIELPARSKDQKATSLFFRFHFRVEGYRGHEKYLISLKYTIDDPSELFLSLEDPECEELSMAFGHEISAPAWFIPSALKFLERRRLMIECINRTRPDADGEESEEEIDEDDEEQVTESYRRRRILNIDPKEELLSNISCFAHDDKRKKSNGAAKILLDEITGVHLAAERELLQFFTLAGLDGFEESGPPRSGIIMPGGMTNRPQGLMALICRIGFAVDPSYFVFLA